LVDRPNLNHRHFALWITSLSYTSIAASTALVTTNPVWVALLSRFWFGEKLSKLSIAGIAVALGGTIAIALGSAGGSGDGSSVMLGNFLALAGSWAVSLYLLAIAYTVAAIVLLPLPLVLKTSYTGYPQVWRFCLNLWALVVWVIWCLGKCRG